MIEPLFGPVNINKAFEPEQIGEVEVTDAESDGLIVTDAFPVTALLQVPEVTFVKTTACVAEGAVIVTVAFPEAFKVTEEAVPLRV